MRYTSMVMELGSKRISPESREQRPAPLRFGCASLRAHGTARPTRSSAGVIQTPTTLLKNGRSAGIPPDFPFVARESRGLSARTLAPVTPLARQISAMVAGTMLFPSSRVVSMQTQPPTSVTMLMAGLRGSPPTASKPLTPRQTPRSLSLPSSVSICTRGTSYLKPFMAVSMNSTSSIPPSPPLKFYVSSKPTLLLPRKSCCRPRRLRALEIPFFSLFLRKA